jgi:3-oxoacyl-[acyl-carrier protein] reductase
MLRVDLGLKDRRAIVLGGTRGIGLAIARGLAAEGCVIAICGRNEAALRDAESELRATGAQIYAAVSDVADPALLGAFLENARQALGGVDILVHNASALALGADASAWPASLQVDLMGAVHAVDRVVPWMMDAGGGSILFVSSISALEAFPIPDFAYTAAKAALVAYAKKLATLYGPQRIRVNAIAPGSTEFPGGIWDVVKKTQPPLYEAIRSSIPAGRLGTLDEIADVAVFLVSNGARWVTGECLAVDGGQHKAMR